MLDSKSITLLGGGVLTGYGASQYLVGKKKGIESWGPLVAGLGIIGYQLYKGRYNVGGDKILLESPVKTPETKNMLLNDGSKIVPVSGSKGKLPNSVIHQKMPMYPSNAYYASYYADNPAFEASVYATEFSSGGATPSHDRNHIYPGII